MAESSPSACSSSHLFTIGGADKDVERKLFVRQFASKCICILASRPHFGVVDISFAERDGHLLVLTFTKFSYSCLRDHCKSSLQRDGGLRRDLRRPLERHVTSSRIGLQVGPFWSWSQVV